MSRNLQIYRNFRAQVLFLPEKLSFLDLPLTVTKNGDIHGLARLFAHKRDALALARHIDVHHDGRILADDDLACVRLGEKVHAAAVRLDGLTDIGYLKSAETAATELERELSPPYSKKQIALGVAPVDEGDRSRAVAHAEIKHAGNKAVHEVERNCGAGIQREEL